MKIPVKKILTKNIIGIHHDAYTGNRAFLYEGECISYTNRDYNVPKKVTECFKRGYSKHSDVRDYDSNSPLRFNPHYDEENRNSKRTI